MLRHPELFVASSAALAIAVAVAACVGDNPDVESPPDAAPDVPSGADSSSGNVGKGCQLPHNCQGARDPNMCPPLALSADASAPRILHVDPCKLSSPQMFTDETGSYTVSPSPSGDYCANSLLGNGPALRASTPTSGFLVTPLPLTARNFPFGTGPFAILVVALQRAGARSNQVLFAAQETTWPYRGPAIVTNFAWARSDADGDGGMSAAGNPTNYVAGQLMWGGDPLTDAASPGLASLSTLPYDCAPHVFRLSRSGSTFSLYVDGKAQDVKAANDPVDGGPIAFTTTPEVRIGNSPENGKNLDGDIGEIIVVRDAPDDAVLEIENALKQRWKIP